MSKATPINLSLQAKFFIISILGIVFLFVLAGVFYFEINTQMDETTIFLNKYLIPTQQVTELFSKVSETQGNIHTILLNASTGKIDENQVYEYGKNQIDELYRLISDLNHIDEADLASSKERIIFNNIKNNLSFYQDKIISAFRLATVNLTLAKQYAVQAHQMQSQLNLEINRFIQESSLQMSRQFSKQVEKTQLRNHIYMILFSVIMLILVLLNIILFYRFVNPLTIRMRSFLDTIKKISKDNSLTTRVPIRGKDEIGQLAKNFNHMLSQLEIAEKDKQAIEQQLMQSQKLESIGNLAGGIAHDFNNLLAGIQGYAQLLELKLQNNPELLKNANVIVQSVKRATELTQQLLGFARKGQYEMVDINVNSIITEVQSLLCRTINKNITLTCDLAPDLWLIRGDSTQISQVLMNIAVNARDAMPGGGELWFETQNLVADEIFCKIQKRLQPGNYVHISITDTGIGIPQQIRDQIFDPFFTTKEVGKGTGLGLSMAYGIIKNHNGDIAVYSDDSGGSVFHLYFPAILSVDESIKHQLIRGKMKVDVLIPNSVLVVDDEEIIRDLIVDLLKDLKNEVDILIARDGEEGVALYEANQDTIDIVILDLIMPKMRGCRSFKVIRKINPTIPVLFVSGYSESGEISALRQTGYVDFIQKPFSREDLIAKINALLKPAL
ncbi:MAG: hypothetical protein COB66_04215 [Coxiella sp. (in: Bacteria)]|nr:MAG: hypothetical protein COB66_04215 [Coxiella sp. (in: g-proteobacteria)]